METQTMIFLISKKTELRARHIITSHIVEYLELLKFPEKITVN